jgi:3-methyladenine DNA glycosylase AlkD
MAGQGTNVIAGLAKEVQTQVLAAEDRTVPTLRNVRRKVTRRVKALEPTAVVDLALLLLSNREVPKWFAYEVVHHHRQALASLTEAHLRHLGTDLDGWGEVDAFACYLTGPAWREGRLNDTVLHRWAVSSDRWWRRVAVVSTVALNSTARGGSGDAARTLALCEIVKHDADDMVVKALSWALRELARKEPEAVRAFLRSNADCLAARVVREVGNKLETGLKNPRSTERPVRRTRRGGFAQE